VSPPSAFGTYRVLHQIGSGVLGPVFRAYDSQNDRLAAVKTFKLMLVPEDAARFAERLRAIALAPPAHHAIIRGIEAGLDRSTPYLALEYAPGDSLDVLLRQSGAWPAVRALPVLRELAAAIDASWAAGTGHGALHPRDIFVAFGPSDVRVTGFGIGQALEAVGAKAPLRRPYSAPERGTDPWDIRADVYSLGVVAFEMLSGQRPVGPDDEASALAADLPADVRATVRRVLGVAMSSAPGDRYDTATAFVDALANVTLDPNQPQQPPVPEVHLVDATAFLDEAEVSQPAVEPATEPAPEPVTPEPAPAPAIRLSAPVVDAPIDLPLSSRPRHEPSQPPRIGSFLNTETEPAHEEAASFPWAAVIAVFVAGLVLAGVVMYQWGWSRGHAAAARDVVQSVTPTPPPTATVAPPVESTASPSATPALVEGAKPDGPPPVGRLVIQSTPAGAIVTIDGRRRGETPVTVEVPLGKHDIQIARSGYVPKTQRVELTKKSAAQTVKLTLPRGPVSTGSAEIDSQPRGARVSIDGKFVGISPLRVPDLSAGEHRFQFELAGHKTVSSTVNIVGGDVKRVTVTLIGGDARKSEEGARR
jgi:serine/threonine protein kinase